MNFVFELVGTVPWGPQGLRDPLTSIGLGGLASHRASQQVRVAPMPALGPDGGVWLLTIHGEVGCLRGEQFHKLALDQAEMDGVTQLVPAVEGGVVLLGVKGQENVLARLRGDGSLVWRRTGPVDARKLDLPALRGDFDALLGDQDGSVYLPGTRLEGVLGRVQGADGTIAVAATFGDFRGRVLIQGGQLLRADYREGRGTWIRRDLKSGKETRVIAAPALHDALALPVAALPDGGALLERDETLFWMTPDGKPRRELPLAGVVRTGERLTVATRVGKDVVLSGWREGRRVEGLNVSSLPPGVRLIAADGSHYYFSMVRAGGRAPDRLFTVDTAGTLLSDESLAEAPHRYTELEGGLGLGRVVVSSQGEVYVIGVDPQGAYLVRVTGP
jgi:hypothetical protein